MSASVVVMETGSRSYRDRRTVYSMVLDVWNDATMLGVEVEWLHGNCRTGADRLFDEVLVTLGFTPRRMDADWDVCETPRCKPEHRKARRDGSTYCPAAGLVRDARMVATRPDYCLAFIAPCVMLNCRKKAPHGSHGASETARMADEAGIEVRVIRP